VTKPHFILDSFLSIRVVPLRQLPYWRNETTRIAPGAKSVCGSMRIDPCAPRGRNAALSSMLRRGALHSIVVCNGAARPSHACNARLDARETILDRRGPPRKTTKRSHREKRNKFNAAALGVTSCAPVSAAGLAKRT